MQANAFCFDGDAALALEVHGVEELFVHFALRQRAGQFEETVGKRGLAMVDVRDDAEVSNELRVHFSRLPIFSMAGRIRTARDFSGGPAAFEQATHAAQKPCRINIQSATNGAARQPIAEYAVVDVPFWARKEKQCQKSEKEIRIGGAAAVAKLGVLWLEGDDLAIGAVAHQR